ncbi:DUF3667 domain-containing protein [Sphingomicrobium nitratireducens]|uniref:DUF3667 domain-containing protein n=1 Tax=Sphingomicrobium nitratireducens TaxID=2964666 RepID=UPI0022406544|nr:DUF3667 domain-containing protein [Sphingomicrobium nitratireducens]
MGEFEAAGELVGGGMLGRAIEPVADGKGGEKIPGPGDCLNCASPLEGHNFCCHCGQKAHVHRTLKGLAHDFIHGILHFDGKFWRTIPMLLWHPGELTRRYVHGQRARYISPIAVFLFTVVAMFAFVVSIGDVDIDESGIGSPATVATSVEAQEKVVAEIEANLAELEKEDFPGISGARTGVKAELSRARSHLAELKGEKPVEKSPKITFGMSGWDVLDEQIQKAESNPSLYLYKVQTKAYKLSWLLIPLSLPFMWLLFPFNRRFKMYDHAVFVTYSLSFMMLLVLVAWLLVTVGIGGGLIPFLLLVPPFHMYRQLRGAYQLSRRGAIARTFLLSIFSVAVLAMFAALMLLIGVVS